MANMKSKSNLNHRLSTFDEMINHFGVVTVMDAYIYDYPGDNILRDKKVDEIYKLFNFTEELTEDNKDDGVYHFICKLDTLKIANVTMDGPDKTITGGRYNNTLLKFGKTATFEIQDALGNAKAISLLSGGVIETFMKNDGSAELKNGSSKALHLTETFSGPKTIIGDSFFIDQVTGAQVPVKIIFYQVIPDSLFNLSQDAEGDATVFDMNGDLATTTITVGLDGNEAKDVQVGVFYSIIPADGISSVGSEGE